MKKGLIGIIIIALIGVGYLGYTFISPSNNTTGTSTNNNTTGTSANNNTTGTSTNNNTTGTSTNNNTTGTSTNNNTASTSANNNTASTSANNNTASTSANNNTASTSANNNTASTSANNNTASTSANNNTASTSTNNNTAGTSTNNNTAGTSTSNNTNNQNHNKRKELAPTLISLYGTWTPTKIVSGFQNSSFKLSDVKSNIIINSNNLIYKGQNAIIPTDDLNISKASNAEFKENYSIDLSALGVTTPFIYYLNGPQSLQFYITSPTTIVINLDGKFVQFTKE